MRSRHRLSFSAIQIAAAVVAASLAVATAPPLVRAAGPDPLGPETPAPGRGVCRADFERLCGGVQPGHGAKRQCLRQHESELSPQCRERVDQARQRIAQLREACAGDVQNLCAGVQPGRGGIARCLREHESELSGQCREAVPQRRGAAPAAEP